MPYKDPEKRKQHNREYSKRYHESHRKEHVAVVAQRKKRIYEWYQSFKGTLKCSCCPESERVCLVFHHMCPKDKKHNIPDMVANGYSEKAIMKEMDKCLVLCANCHRKLHAGIISPPGE